MTRQILPLRPYQQQALDALAESLARVNRPAVVLPTGGGKTVVFAHQAADFIAANPGRRVLILVHTDELVRQANEKLRSIAPHLDVGIVKAARRDNTAQVIVASVQSLRNSAQRERIADVGLVIVDECHHATAKTYRDILTHYGCFGWQGHVQYHPPEVPAVGYTATLMRGDGASLGSVWQDVAFSRDIGWMVRKRYLINPRGITVKVPDLDLSGVRSTKADFRESDLGDAMAESFAPELVAVAYNEHAAGRKALAFVPTVAAAHVFAEAFRTNGIPAEVIHGGMALEERRRVLAWHKPGTALVNCMVLTEGYDDPEVDCIIMARPTKSQGLYIQIVGRGLRVDPARPYEEQDCLILDVVGAAGRMDLRSIADLTDRPVKEPREGQTLTDLLDELEEFEPDPVPVYAGPVEVTEFDPLAACSTRVWQRTKGGLYFVPAGKDAYAFLVETEPGRYVLAWATKQRTSLYSCCVEKTGGRECACGLKETASFGATDHAGDLEMVMAWGEDLAVDMGADPFETYSKKKAPWRNAPASEAQLDYARRLGLKPPDRKLKAGEVSDRINKVVASRRLDPLAAKIRERIIA